MMKHTFPYPHVLVFGAAKSGVGASNLLRHHGIGVTMVDERQPKDFRSLIRMLKRQGITWYFGPWDQKVFEHVRAVVTSPGIPPTHPLLRQAGRMGMPILSEVELASYFTDAPILAITGTNGKTTTTTICGDIMSEARHHTIVSGNIGFAFSNGVLSSNLEEARGPRVLVTEVSSFQLEAIKRFRPHVAALLNFSQDHLDRYPSMREYIEAKYRITLNQDSRDYLILNQDDPFCMKLAERTRAQVFTFSMNREVEQGAYLKDGVIYLREGKTTIPVCDRNDIPIPGDHNVENVLASFAACRRLGVQVPTLVSALRKCKGVEHRTEKVVEKNNIIYYNDSKATNLDSLEKALQSFSRPIVLIAGGRDKKSDYSRLNALVSQKVKALVLIGEAAPLIEQAWSKIVPTKHIKFATQKDGKQLEDVEKIKLMTEVVKTAQSLSAPGDIVLLSPACSSYDQFDNFEERGSVYKRCVREVVTGR